MVQENFFGSTKISGKIFFWGQKNILVKKLFRSKNILGQKNFFGHTFFSQKILVKKFLGQNNFLIKKIWVKKILGKEIFLIKTIWVWFFLSKKTGRVNPRGRIYNPPPENNRVKIVLGCCLFCLLTLPTKFQTPRIIISGRSRVCVVGWGGVGGVKW